MSSRVCSPRRRRARPQRRPWQERAACRSVRTRDSRATRLSIRREATLRSGRSIKCEYRERRFPSCRHTHLRRRRSIVERGWQLAPSRRQRLALSPHIRPPRPPLSFLNFIPPAVPAAPPLPTRALPVTTHHVRPRGLLVVVLSLMRSSAGPRISPMRPRRRPRRSSPLSYSTWPCSVSSSVSSPSSVLSSPQSTNQEHTYPLRGKFSPGLAICGGCGMESIAGGMEWLRHGDGG